MKKKVEFTEKEYMEIYHIFIKISKPQIIPNFDKFKTNIDKFIEITYDAYIPNIGSKDEAFIKWVQYIGSRDLASKYFKAVDTWNAYT
ncbi:MAG: hypothetical protein CEE43_14465 [Promethearchaeota archaeon Loki_b32]|nr:MAG: hypothetical protein CEE43_14465 [Candidatus Lokiarchaeota archaeon Loki_b32]